MYFSELDLINNEHYQDCSYHGFEEQLLMRYEDLKERYLFLSCNDAPTYGEDRFNDMEYLYTPVEYFETLFDVHRAMEITRGALEEKCDVKIDGDGNVIECREEEGDPNQISIFEVVLLPTWFKTAAA